MGGQSGYAGYHGAGDVSLLPGLPGYERGWGSHDTPEESSVSGGLAGGTSPEGGVYGVLESSPLAVGKKKGR